MTKTAEFTAHAGLERVSILIALLHETLGYYDREGKEGHDLHPCINSDQEKELLGSIGDNLAELYQLMGHQMIKAEEETE